MIILPQILPISNFIQLAMSGVPNAACGQILIILCGSQTREKKQTPLILYVLVSGV